jgi:tetratricopeptide (TPR) repeat protein
MLYLEQLNDPEEAHALLAHALELDNDYSWTQGLMGDYYAKTGRSLADPQEKSAALQEAARHYNLAAQTAKRTETQIKVGNLVALAGIHLELQQIDQAIEAYEQAVAAGPRAQDLWRIQETLARLYGQSGSKELALKNAAAALTNAPEEHKARVQTLLAQLEALP